ncbi:MAG: hypothetical protein HY936_06235 [Nitrosomonadales bacterium]|nr:hypothetical protein [Nitrosomonadales bacterium]
MDEGLLMGHQRTEDGGQRTDALSRLRRAFIKKYCVADKTSVFCLLSSVLCPLSSVFCPLPSVAGNRNG